MESSKEPVAPKQSKAAPAPPEPLSYEAAQALLQETQASYGRAQQDAQAAAQKRYEEAYRDYLSEMQAVGDNVRKNLEDAHKNYLRSMQEAAGNQDAQRLATETHQNYLSTVQGIQEEAQRRFEVAFSNHADGIREAQDTFQRLSLEAYRAYLKSQQDVWTKIDVDAVVSAAATAAGRGTL